MNKITELLQTNQTNKEEAQTYFQTELTKWITELENEQLVYNEVATLDSLKESEPHPKLGKIVITKIETKDLFDQDTGEPSTVKAQLEISFYYVSENRNTGQTEWSAPTGNGLKRTFDLVSQRTK
jgi:hypothetical protein